MINRLSNEWLRVVNSSIISSDRNSRLNEELLLGKNSCHLNWILVNLRWLVVRWIGRARTSHLRLRCRCSSLFRTPLFIFLRLFGFLLRFRLWLQGSNWNNFRLFTLTLRLRMRLKHRSWDNDWLRLCLRNLSFTFTLLLEARLSKV